MIYPLSEQDILNAIAGTSGLSVQDIFNEVYKTWNLTSNVAHVALDTTLSCTVAVDGTYVQPTIAPAKLVIPANSILRGFIISTDAPAIDGTGAPTINYAIGTAANDNITLTGSDVNVMKATGAKTDAFVHGAAAADNVAAFYPIDGDGRYIATDLDLFFNLIATSDGGTGTVTVDVKINALYDRLG